MALAAIGRDDIANFLHQEEMSLVEEEKLNQIIVTVCDEVNAYASACPHNAQIQPGAGKVPQELKHAACILIRKAILGRAPGTSDELDQSTREAEYQAALATLRAASSCELYLADYSESGEEAPALAIGGGQPLMSFMSL